MPKALNLDLTLIENQLCRERLEPPGELPWLEESYRTPEAFWQALKLTQDPFLALPGKSTPFEKYDFYHDIIVRNQQNSGPAFLWYDSVLGWQEISYPDLGARANRKAAAWTRFGVQAGQKVCILYPLGVEYVVSLLAALKLGLTVSILPPGGKRFLHRRLEVLAPDHIVTDEMYFSLLPAWADNIVQEGELAEEINTKAEHSHTYPSGGVMALLFDPCSQESHIPRELTSDATYLCPLRDGIIALGLRPGHIIAAPGFHFLETQPGLLLACLLNGGTYLHLELDDMARNPELLTAHPIRVIGVSSRVRDTLLDKPVKFEKPWHYWFRNPAESPDVEQWQSFIEALGLEEVFSGNVKYDVALGGCSLFSIKRKGQVHFHVLPSAGVQWALCDPAGDDLESLADYGRFCAVAPGREDGEKTTSASILAKNRKQWLFLGSRVSGRAGRNYPRAEILEAIQTLPYCSCCSIADIPPFGPGVDPAFVLLVFTGGKTGVGEAAVAKEILSAIEREMGNEFFPDRIQFFPLYPRYGSDGTVDHDWCRDQYLTGGLFRKSREETYRCLAQLRQYLA
jgi:hypothetical protein